MRSRGVQATSVSDSIHDPKKHDEKTRHVGLAHVAQPSYRAFSFNFGEVFNGAYDTLLRTCPPSRITPLRRTCWGPFGIPQLLGLPFIVDTEFPRFWPFGPAAGTMHLPPLSKISCPFQSASAQPASARRNVTKYIIFFCLAQRGSAKTARFNCLWACSFHCQFPRFEIGVTARRFRRR